MQIKSKQSHPFFQYWILIGNAGNLNPPVLTFIITPTFCLILNPHFTVCFNPGQKTKEIQITSNTNQTEINGVHKCKLMYALRRSVCNWEANRKPAGGNVMFKALNMISQSAFLCSSQAKSFLHAHLAGQRERHIQSEWPFRISTSSGADTEPGQA